MDRLTPFLSFRAAGRLLGLTRTQIIDLVWDGELDPEGDGVSEASVAAYDPSAAAERKRLGRAGPFLLGGARP